MPVQAYSLGNSLRPFVLPSEEAHWPLTSIHLKLVRIGSKMATHSRMTIFQMAEVAVPEKLSRSMLSRIHRLVKACRRVPGFNW
jgi:hypothetical protein